MRRLAMLLLVSLAVVGIGLYVLLVPEEASGKDCGGQPLAVLTQGAGGEAASAGLAKDCDTNAADSVALGFGVIGCGAVMAIAAAALRERPG